MAYDEGAPPRDLSDDVQGVWELRDDANAFAQPIFPDGRIEIVVHLGERPRPAGGGTIQPSVMVAGQMTQALRLAAAPGLHAVGIRFTPAGARRWLRLPLHELTDRIAPLEDVSPALARALLAAAGDGATVADRRRAIERVLREHRGQGRHRRRPWSSRRALLDHGGACRIDVVADRCGVSGRQLARLFLDGVGIGPKGFARAVRMQRVLALLRHGVAAAEVAQRCGFADQSHLANEFRRVAGVPVRDVALAEVPFLAP